MVQALKKCERDGMVTCAVARILWAERKVDQARKWFERAVRLDKDYGDGWAYFYKFEAQHGSEEQRAAVAARCAGRTEKGEEGPRLGERWVAVSKHPDNDTVGGGRLSVEEILRAVAAKLGTDGG